MIESDRTKPKIAAPNTSTPTKVATRATIMFFRYCSAVFDNVSISASISAIC
jgi:hypothetical protein